MSAILSHPAVSGPKAQSHTPKLCGAPSIRHYRRSATTKAPRKRTFLAQMEKFDARLIAPAGVSYLGADNVAMLSIGDCRGDDFAFCGGDNSGNNNRGGNKKRGGDNGEGDSFADGFPRLSPVLSQALLGALAITVAVAAFPATSQAAQALPSPARAVAVRSSAASIPSRPRSKVMHVACKGSTLVVPLPAGGETQEVSATLSRIGHWHSKKVVDAPIALSANEAAIVSAPQYRVRESMRV